MSMLWQIRFMFLVIPFLLPVIAIIIGLIIGFVFRIYDNKRRRIRREERSIR